MLTGTWFYKREQQGVPGAISRGEMGFDSEGHFNKLIVTSPIIVVANVKNYQGSLHVYPDGRVEGTIVDVESFGLLIHSSKSIYRLRFNADGTISGRRVTHVIETTGGVVTRNETVGYKYWMTKK